MSVRRSALPCAPLLLVLCISCGADSRERGAARADLASVIVTAVPPTAELHVWGAATALPDGRVLVTGGSTDHGAEIFDPVASTWTRAGTLAGSWTEHLAIPLLDGRVLLACTSDIGYDKSTPIEVYRPSDGSWTVHGSYPTRQSGHAARLADGRVLITGGYIPGAGDTGTSIVWNPETDALASTGSLTVPRALHRSLTLVDGRVLVTGGRSGTVERTSSVELYDPATGTFWRGRDMLAARRSHTSTLLLDGRVLVAGGNETGGPDAEVFDPMYGTWTAAGPMAAPRARHSAFRLADGRVLLLGGNPVSSSGSFAAVEIFDPGTGLFTPGEPLPQARYAEASASLADGRILVASGNLVNALGGTRSALILDPDGICTPQYTSCSAAGATCGMLPDGCGAALACGSCANGATCLANACQADGVRYLGDATGDGKVDVVDALRVAQASAGLATVDPAVADVDCDEVVTITDAMLISQYSSATIAQLPCRVANFRVPDGLSVFDAQRFSAQYRYGTFTELAYPELVVGPSPAQMSPGLGVEGGNGPLLEPGERLTFSFASPTYEIILYARESSDFPYVSWAVSAIGSDGLPLAATGELYQYTGSVSDGTTYVYVSGMFGQRYIRSVSVEQLPTPGYVGSAVVSVRYGFSGHVDFGSLEPQPAPFGTTAFGDCRAGVPPSPTTCNLTVEASSTLPRLARWESKGLGVGGGVNDDTDVDSGEFVDFAFGRPMSSVVLYLSKVSPSSDQGLTVQTASGESVSVLVGTRSSIVDFTGPYAWGPVTLARYEVGMAEGGGIGDTRLPSGNMIAAIAYSPTAVRTSAARIDRSAVVSPPARW